MPGSPRRRSMELIWVMLLGAACSGEQIEVGARVDEARRTGKLPAARSIRLPDTLEDVEGWVRHAWRAGQRNIPDEAFADLLAAMEVAEPLRSDLVTYLRSLDPDRVSPEQVPLQLLAFLVERHQVPGDASGVDLPRLLRLGLALRLEDPALEAELLEPAPGSRLLRCRQAREPTVLMTAYADAVVRELRRQGYACDPVRVRG